MMPLKETNENIESGRCRKSAALKRIEPFMAMPLQIKEWKHCARDDVISRYCRHIIRKDFSSEVAFEFRSDIGISRHKSERYTWGLHNNHVNSTGVVLTILST